MSTDNQTVRLGLVLVSVLLVITGCGRGSDDTEEITADVIEAINDDADCDEELDGIDDETWSSLCASIKHHVGPDSELTYQQGYSLSPGEVGLAYYSEIDVVDAEGGTQTLRLCYEAEGLLLGTPVMTTAELAGSIIFETGDSVDCPS